MRRLREEPWSGRAPNRAICTPSFQAESVGAHRVRPVERRSEGTERMVQPSSPPRARAGPRLLVLAITGAMLVALFFKVLSSAGPSPWHRWSGLLAAAFFCVHAGNTQPVNYISARSELLSGIGVLGALLVYACLPRARRFQL